MIEKEKIISFIENRLTKNRFIHSLNVAKVAVELAKIYNIDIYNAEVAALLHDNAKSLNNEELMYYVDKYNIKLDDVDLFSPQILHSYVGAYLAKDNFDIDEDIFNAIYNHTVGRKNMSMLEKIIFIADIIEEGRNFNGVEELRELAFKDINKAIIMSCEKTIEYVISKGLLLHLNTIELRNYLIMGETNEKNI
ncbi:MAG: bis(5'-nucleosyl)-tetraphosphatase (symmetrical) YqeK [Clostridiales bacterium]|nr:bis(5'-nucleosyl)-tetraphosphatase (symmetrical) YqeK [Clostridiales bacterium]